MAYFGEPYENENCGMCDNCRKAKMEQVNLTTPAQMFLSCLHWVNKSETKEVFDEAYFIGTLRDENTSIPICLPTGALYIIDILRGEKQEKIIKNEHHKLSPWGKGKDYSKAQWCHFALQFFQNDLYERDGEDGSLHLTDKGRKVNTKKITPADWFWGFPMDSVDMDLKNSVTAELNTYESESEEQYQYDPELFEKLCHKRRNIAEEELIRASRVLPRDLLKEMATQLPQTPEEFGQIKGIGRVRMKYADDFLPIIHAYCEECGIDSVESTTEVTNTYEPVPEEPNEYIPSLFEKLRDKRQELAEAERIQASRIMTIASLKKMAAELPQTVEEFGEIHGVGEAEDEIRR